MKRSVNRVRRWTLIGLALSLFIPLLAACSQSKDLNDPENRRTLRIGLVSGSKQEESWIRQQYTDLFEFSHPGIEIEIVPAIDWAQQQFENFDENGRYREPDRITKVKEIMTSTSPVDVMIFDFPLLGPLVEENLLLQLDPLMKKDNLDPSVFVPAVMDAIRAHGNNNIYALAPTYNPSALFYNKKLFQDKGVTPPRDGMSWDEVFALARQVSGGTGENAVFGFAFNQWGGTGEYFWDIQNFISPLQLKLYDDNAEFMTVNSPQWKNIWDTVYQLHKDRVLPTQEDMYREPPMRDGKYRYNPYQGRPFMNGKVAMTIGEYSMINDLQQLNDNAEKLGMEKIDWDVVTVPYHTAAPGIGVNSSISTLAGINTKAQNQEDAWEFVKFMNGEEWAKFKSRSTYELSTRTAFIKVREGMSYRVEAFTQMQPAPYPGSSPQEQRLKQERPNLYLVDDLVNQVYMSVFQDQRTVDEALEYLEKKGNELLQKIKANPDGQIEDPFGEGQNGNDAKGGMMRAVPVPAG